VGARDVSGALILAALAAPISAAQDAPPAAAARSAGLEHARCVASERILDFLAAYATASGERRSAAEAVLARHRPEGAGVATLPKLEAILEATATLAARPAAAGDETEARRADLERIAVALDLAPSPGAVESASEGLGAYVTVRVRPIVPLDVTEAFSLALYWIAPDGGETRARREPVEPGVVGASGFEMYLRAPLSGPGRWRLVAELERGGVAVRGRPVDVDCVADLGLRIEGVLAPDAGTGEARAYLARALADHVRQGSRTAACLSPGEMLAALESGLERAAAAGTPVPVERAFTDVAGVEHWMWSWKPPGELARAILIASPLAETPDAPLSGALGAAWRAAAERVRAELLATHLPLDAVATRSLLARVRERAGKRELVVVTRGDSLARLQIAMPTGDPSLADALVASTVIASTSPAHPLAPLPRLVVAPAADRASGPGFEGVAGASFALLNDPALPGLAAAWIERRAAAASKQ
jgi:hypothetical protein